MKELILMLLIWGAMFLSLSLGGSDEDPESEGEEVNQFSSGVLAARQ